MDRLIYTAMTGASAALEQHATTAHNLANVGTQGFRSQWLALKEAPLTQSSRAQVMVGASGSDFSQGALQQTGRTLDLAIQGDGWFVVQDQDGTQAMTRSGALRVSTNGILQNVSGWTVLGDAGPISVPPDATLSVAKDGTISAILAGGGQQALGRLKLVRPDNTLLQRADDGLFRLPKGQSPSVDEAVTVISGALEGSNVNVVDAMVKMIAVSRQFELNLQMIKTAEANEAKASQVVNLGV